MISSQENAPVATRPLKWQRKLIFSGALFVTMVVIAELSARRAFPSPDHYFLIPPNLSESYPLPTAMLTNLPPVVHRSINAQGVRGEPLGADPEYRILAIGGSTTACNTVDQSQAWPARVQTLLSNQRPKEKIWVGNIGKNGLSTRSHLITLDRYLPQHPRIDALVFCVGVNDFLTRLARDNDYRPLSNSEILSDPALLQQTFAIMPVSVDPAPWYRKFGLWRFAKQTKAQFIDRSEANLARMVAGARARRRDLPVRSELPDLGPALEEYEGNLAALIEGGRARHLRVIFMTHPVLWKKTGMTREEIETLMFGYVGKELRQATAFYSPGALAEGMDRYNAATKRVCDRLGVECLDLAGNLKSDLSLLYDDTHFNISGCDQIAHFVASYLLGRPPFATAVAN
jgi:lysophospholipase L1-like esterase